MRHILVFIAVTAVLAACGASPNASPAPATAAPLSIATAEPTAVPAATPTATATATPVPTVTSAPTTAPTAVPTAVPTTAVPTAVITPRPTAAPTVFVMPPPPTTKDYFGVGTITRILGPRLIEMDVDILGTSRANGWSTPIIVRWDERTAGVGGKTVTEYVAKDGSRMTVGSENWTIWLRAGSYDPATKSYWAVSLP